MTTDVAQPKRHGLAVLLDIFVAPNAAFAELRRRPHWGWAFLAICVLGMIGGYLQVPAGQHAALGLMAHDPKFATLPPEQAENAKKLALTTQRFAWLFFPLIAMIGIAFAAMIYLVANAAGRGRATFAQLFGLAANIAVINFGVAYFLVGVIATLRGPEAFSSTTDIVGTLPSLGWLAPGAPTKLLSFLSSFTLFQIWSIVLIALGLHSLAGISKGLAWGTAILIALCGAALGAAFAR